MGMAVTILRNPAKEFKLSICESLDSKCFETNEISLNFIDENVLQDRGPYFDVENFNNYLNFYAFISLEQYLVEE